MNKSSQWNNLKEQNFKKKKLQNQSFKPQRRANWLSIMTSSHQSKIKPWHQIVPKKKKKKGNSWPRVIHWKPNVNESWSWVIIKRIKIQPWVENQELTLCHHPNSKKKKINPEWKIKSNPESKNPRSKL